MSDRSCGGCTACCKTHAIQEIDKKRGVWCQHCSIGRGCQIYGNHPQSCKEFQCAWLGGVGKDEDRPDRVRVVAELRELDVFGVMLLLFEVTPGTLAGRFAQEQTERCLLELKKPVAHFPLVGRSIVYLPHGSTVPADAVFQVDGVEGEVVRYDPRRVKVRYVKLIGMKLR